MFLKYKLTAVSSGLLGLLLLDAGCTEDNERVYTKPFDGGLCAADEVHVGCRCDHPGEISCRVAGTGSGVTCSSEGVWATPFSDGPCAPSVLHGEDDSCFSPSQNVSSAGKPGALGCACDTRSEGECVDGVGSQCIGGSWRRGDGDAPCTTQKPDAGAPDTDGGTTACGARAGDTCAVSEYCAYEPGELCGQADAEATCKPRPDICPAIYDPVCGCDQKTYGNACAAALVGVGVFERGECATGDAGKACGARAGDTCAADEYCAYVPDQICGHADAEATCKPRPTGCTKEYNPVCGCDMKTYGTACMAALNGTGVFEKGVCK